MFEQETSSLLNLLDNIGDDRELDSVVNNELKKFEDLNLANYFKKICEEKGLTKGKLIKAADLDRNYGYQILDGSKKPTKDKILRLCFGAKLNFKETQRALKIGNSGELYAKNPRDFIIIYAIKNNFSLYQVNEKLYENNFEIL